MQVREVEFDTIGQQQAVFGAQDHLVKIIEKELSVSIVLRAGKGEIRGDDGASVEQAAQVMEGLQKLYDKAQPIDEQILYRLLEDAASGEIEETFQAMGSVVTMSYKGVPIRCKTAGQRGYIRALRENVVTLCIGPAGTGKTYLAVAQAVQELKSGEIERIIMSRPAIEAGRSALDFCRETWLRKWILI